MLRITRIVLALIVLLSAGTVVNASPVDWKAQWIWQAQDGPANAWVAFRKTVNISSVPTKVIANIAADSKYWLWINGELVVFEGGVARGPSPARPWNRVKEIWKLPPESKPSNTWYEETDITRHLRSGENTIAVLVWYWGRETHKGTHIDSGQGGLIFQADLGEQLLISDRSWKVRADSAYAHDSGDTGEMIVQYNVKYDARNEIGAWTSPEFSDADWKAAIEKGAPPSAPWYALKRNYVPPLVNHGLQYYGNYPEAKFPFTSSGETITCTLPFNQQINPYLEVEGEDGKLIKIDTDNKHNRIKGFYTTKTGKQSFECYSWMNGNEVRYDIPAGVKVLTLKYRWMSVGEMAGAFECSDPFYQRLWWMGRNTLFVCARDNFMDCPDRERACWIGDVADQASYLFYCMDESGRQLLKKTLRTTMAYSQNGVYAALGPLRLRELPSQSLQFVDQGIWQFYMNTGDVKTLRYAYPYVREYLKLWSMEESGLPKYRRGGSMDAWDWSDWGQKDTLDKEILQRALYFMALNSAMKMADVVDATKDIAWYKQRIQSMRRAFDKRYWTGKYYSSNPAKLADDRANCLTVLCGLASKDKFEPIVNHVLIPNHYCSPHFEWMVEEALCYAGRHDAALKRMKVRYKSQVERKEMSTLYEKFPHGGTYNHAWNAPNTILSKHVAGVLPTKPGWSEYQVLPNLVHLSKLKVVVPSVKGDISIDIRQREKAYEIELVSPAETSAIVGVPKTIGRVAKIQANDETIWTDRSANIEVHGVEPAGEDDRFIKYRVVPGTWRISAIAR